MSRRRIRSIALNLTILVTMVATVLSVGCELVSPESGNTTTPVEISEESGNAITLVETGEERMLPERILGLQAVPLYEKMTDNPIKRSIAREMAPAIIRFPGGMVGNYYNWQTGQLEVPVYSNSSATTLFYARVADQIKGLHPQGVHIEEYSDFSQAIGAEIVLVPNLESSTVAEQVVWFSEMKAEGILPRRIELGNEFFLAMLGDPNILRKWPDAPAAMRVMKEYRDAFQPYFVAKTLVAVQAAGSRFYVSNDSGKLVPVRRLEDWDNALKNELWFDAVTLHFYPDVGNIAGPGERSRLPDNADKIFPALMARCDSGLEEALNDIKERLPGKEIWITEWGARSGTLATVTNEKEEAILGMNIHLATRMVMTMLRNESVTMALYHMLNFSGGPMSLYRPDLEHGGYAPLGPAEILRWFNQAANGGATYQRLKVEGARQVTSSTTSLESYHDVEAVLFRKGGQTTVIIHNASTEEKTLKLAKVMDGRLPKKIETISTLRLADDYSRSVPPIQTLAVSRQIELPPYSITRLVWE